MKLVAVVLLGASSMVFGITSRAQTVVPQESSSRGAVISKQDLDLLRKDLRAKRRALIAANLRLTETEGERFWPVYDQYIKELIAINDKKFALIQEYANTYQAMTTKHCYLSGSGLTSILLRTSYARSTCPWSPRYWMERRPRRSSSSTGASR